MTIRRTLTTAVCAGLLLVTTACGNDGDSPSASPAEDGATFVSGDFGDIPIHPLADPVGPKSTKDDVIAQSFVARNITSDDLFAWYEERLDGWNQTEAPHALGEAPQASSRARWEREDRRLIMTVSNAPTLEADASADDDPAVQYSLSLEPTSRPLPAGEDG